MNTENPNAWTDEELDALLESGGRRVGEWFAREQEAGLRAALALTNDTPVTTQARADAPGLADADVWVGLCAGAAVGAGTGRHPVSSAVLVRAAVEVMAAVESLHDPAEHPPGGEEPGAPTPKRASEDLSADGPGRVMRLVEEAQAGDRDAFSQLYSEYLDTVYRYIYYRVGGRALAEDLTSETFLRALRRLGQFTWQGRDFGAWLVTIARNLVNQHFRSSQFRLEVTADAIEADGFEISAEAHVVETLSNEALLSAVRRLKPNQQECVALRFFQGLSIPDTARVMGLSEADVHDLQFRAVRALGKLLPKGER